MRLPRPAIAGALVASLILVPVAADARKLRHKASGFSTVAPKGYKLRHSDDGVYTIQNKKSFVRVLLVESTNDAGFAGEEILRAAGGQVLARAPSTVDTFAATVLLNGAQLEYEVARTGENLRVATYGPRPPKSKKARLRPLGLGGALQLTPEQLAALRQIVGGIQGGQAIRLQGDIPLRPFVTADRSAQAFVPDLPGWTAGGTQGAVEGGKVDEGIFAFGISYIVQLPTNPFPNPQLPTAFPPLNQQQLPQVMFGEVLPQWFRICCNTQVGNPQNVTLVPQSEGILGGISGMYSLTLTAGGRQVQALFNVGAADVGLGFGWAFYYSMIGVVLPARPGLGAALMQTWASWDPSADQARRRNETLFTILTTNFGGGPIDWAVFDAAAAKWSEYIRG